MDLEICAGSSLVGALVLSLRDFSTGYTLKVFSALFAVQYLALKIYRFFIYPHFFSPLRHVPGPKDHHFFIGQVLNQIASGSPNEPYVSWMKQWPTADTPFVRYMTFGNTETLLCTSLDAHREIHVHKVYSFEKPGWHARMIQPIIGAGIVFAKGEEHKSQRKTLQSLFSIQNLKTLVPQFQAASLRLSDKFDAAIVRGEGIIEVAQEYSSLTLEVVGNFVLGIDMTGHLASEISRCYHAVFDQPFLGQVLIGVNAHVPVRWLPLEANRKYLEANATIHRLLKTVIRDRVRDVEARGLKGRGGIAEGRDVLTYMVEEKCVTENPDKWDENLILNQMLNFVSAGHETTANLLVWATHRMTCEPYYQDRLRAEVKDLLRRRPVPDFTDLQSLPYMSNFTNECLRYYCPAIIVPREAQHDVTVCGTFIPKGTTVLIFPAVLHYNPTIWGPDADRFDPDRWDRLEDTPAAADPGAFNAFVQGPRMCPGRVLAVCEFKAVLVEILSKFVLEPLPGSGPGDPDLELVNPSPVLKARRGLKVRVRRLSGEEEE